MVHYDRQIVVGVVFDLSLQHHTDTRRYIDIVKEGMIGFATKLGLNCGVFVAHPDNNTMPRQQGEGVAAISSYIEPKGFHAGESLLQAYNMISCQDADEKYVLLFTDRFKKEMLYHYGKAGRMNEKKQSGCKFLVFGLGEKYDRNTLKQLEGANCEVHHLKDPSWVGQVIVESIIIGV